MSAETILTDEQIVGILHNTPLAPMPSHHVVFARAIEQAVLQSDEVQRLLEDRKRLDWLESSADSHGFCHAGFGDYIYYAHQQDGCPTVREVIDAAMEKQP